jgi:hypothetical protein
MAESVKQTSERTSQNLGERKYFTNVPTINIIIMQRTRLRCGSDSPNTDVFEVPELWAMAADDAKSNSEEPGRPGAHVNGRAISAMPVSRPSHVANTMFGVSSNPSVAGMGMAHMEDGRSTRIQSPNLDKCRMVLVCLSTQRAKSYT